MHGGCPSHDSWSPGCLSPLVSLPASSSSCLSPFLLAPTLDWASSPIYLSAPLLLVLLRLCLFMYVTKLRIVLTPSHYQGNGKQRQQPQSSNAAVMSNPWDDSGDSNPWGEVDEVKDASNNNTDDSNPWAGRACTVLCCAVLCYDVV